MASTPVTAVEVFTVVLATISVIVAPLMVMIIRMAVKWTRVEEKLNTVVGELREIVGNGDRVHLAIMDEIRRDRDATNQRLRWLEEYLWKKG